MNFPTGEKTEQATPRKLEEALKRGQFARSAEVQTVFVLMAGLMALMFTGGETWKQLVWALTGTLGHLHDLPVSLESMQGHFVSSTLILVKCTAPVVLAAMVGGLLAGGMQSRFQTASEVLAANWERLNPMSGLKRVFSMQSAPVAAMGLVKLAAIVFLTYGQVQSILGDPIFYSAVDPARISTFMAETAFRIVLRVGVVLLIIAGVDYAYQFWKTSRELMMTKDEVKDELKHTEGNPHVKSRLRRRKRSIAKHKMLAEVAKADVVVTNPTRLAIALRYDRKTMKAPRIVAKGSRLNAQAIREMAQKHQVPMVENKPLARLMFKYGKVGGEIPAQLYVAVAELLAWVYRTNRYRYYTEQNKT